MTDNGWTSGRLERWGAWLASGIGGTFLLVGLVFGFRWAAQQGWFGWMGPEVLFGGALMLGAAVLASGELLWSKGLKAVAAGVAGAGLGSLYLTLFVGYDWYELLSAPVAAVALAGVTALGALFAIRRDSELMANLGFLSGLATPLLLSQGNGQVGLYFGYLVLLNIGALTIVRWRGWASLAWVTAMSTCLLRLLWGAFLGGPEHGGTAAISAAVLGVGWALVASDRRTSPKAAAPLLFGSVGMLLAAIPVIGLGARPEVAVGLHLVALLCQTSALQVAAARREVPPIAWLAQAMAGVAVIAMAVRWTVEGVASGPAILALGALPMLTSWTLLAATDGPVRERYTAHLVWLQSVLSAAAVAAVTEQWGVLALVGVLGLGLAWLAELRITRGPFGLKVETLPGFGALTALAVLLAAGCVVPAALEDPVPALALSLIGAVIALVPPALMARSAEGRWHDHARWLPALAAPVLLVPAGVALDSLDWMGIAGLAPLALGALCLGLAGWLHTTRDAEAENGGVAMAVYVSLGALLATLAVPMQLEQEWLTVAWAAQGAALAWASRRVRHPAVAGFGLLLLSVVFVRLCGNPAVLDYHLVQRPGLMSWILYGYGLPAAALWGASRWLTPPTAWKALPWRAGLQVASLVVVFAGLNLEVSHAFAQGEALTLLDEPLSARMLRTLLWTGYGTGLLLVPQARWLRIGGVGLLVAGVVKVLAADVWLLEGLPRVLVFVGVAVCFLATAAILQLRNRTPTTEAA